jgi:hypothetical protein
MKLNRRTFLHLAGGAAALPTISRSAWTQALRPCRSCIGIFPTARRSSYPRHPFAAANDKSFR